MVLILILCFQHRSRESRRFRERPRQKKVTERETIRGSIYEPKRAKLVPFTTSYTTVLLSRTNLMK